MLVFRFLFLLSLAKSFPRVKRLPHIKFSTQSEDTGVELSFREEIENVIDSCLVHDPTSGKLSAKVDPALLVEKAHLLARSGIYEEAIRERLNSCASPFDVEVLEAVDAQLRAFVLSERKSRARTKLNYVIAGATSNRLEQAIQVLGESDEIDDALLAYTDAVIAKEAVRGGGPAALAEEERSAIPAGGASRAALEVLQLVRDRLRAERVLRRDGRVELRLLAGLLATRGLDAREQLLRGSLTRMEEVEAFSSLLEEATGHFSRDRTGADLGSKSVTGSGSGSVGTLERLRDIALSLERLRSRLRTGLRDDSQYSSSPEDYLDPTP